MSEEELVIDEKNFDEYFKDVRKNAPQPGQVMAVYTTMAELVDGNLKRDLIYLLSHTNKYNESIVLLRKLGWAEQDDAVRVCREITEDLMKKVPIEEILSKPYTYKLQAFYYTDKVNVPKDDPHWSWVEIRKVGESGEKERVEHIGGAEIRSKIRLSDEETPTEDGEIKEEDNSGV